MQRRTRFVSALAALAVSVTVGLMASEMSFKLNYRLRAQGQAVGGGVSRSGSQMLTLPYRRQVGMSNAFDLIQDIGGSAVVAQVARYVRSVDAFASYSGTSGAAFPLAPGEFYLVQLAPAAPAGIDLIVVGSHDHRVAIDLLAQGSAVSAAGGAVEGVTPRVDLSRSGTNPVGLGYNWAGSNALQLINEVNEFAGKSVVFQVAQYIQSLDVFAGYTGATGTAFSIIPGDGYLIQVNEDVLGWDPDTY